MGKCSQILKMCQEDEALAARVCKELNLNFDEQSEFSTEFKNLLKIQKESSDKDQVFQMLMDVQLFAAAKTFQEKWYLYKHNNLTSDATELLLLDLIKLAKNHKQLYKIYLCKAEHRGFAAVQAACIAKMRKTTKIHEWIEIVNDTHTSDEMREIAFKEVVRLVNKEVNSIPLDLAPLVDFLSQSPEVPSDWAFKIFRGDEKVNYFYIHKGNFSEDTYLFYIYTPYSKAYSEIKQVLISARKASREEENHLYMLIKNFYEGRNEKVRIY